MQIVNPSSLQALRNYLLFHDGEFAQHLSSALFNEVSEEASWAAGIVNPDSSSSNQVGNSAA